MATTAACNIIGLRFSENSSNAKKELVCNNKAGEVLKQSLFYSSCNKTKSIVILNNKPRLLPLMLVNAIPGGRAIEEDHTALETIFRGRFVEGDRFVYRQAFAIRSYEIGPDKTVTIETLVNFLQETGQNHARRCGMISGNGYSATPEMSLRKLICVATRIHVQVLRYSKWGDEIEVDTWFDAPKNRKKRDWIVRDRNTKEIIARATSTWVVMNEDTRRLSKVPEEVRQEVAPFSCNRVAIASEETDCINVHKLTDDTAERIRSGISPGWSDMDANQHVNNVKYIGWILESVPKEVLENYYITSITLEFRRECTYSNLLESMTSPAERVKGASKLQYTHLLRLQDDKSELVRAKTEWHLNRKKK